MTNAIVKGFGGLIGAKLMAAAMLALLSACVSFPPAPTLVAPPVIIGNGLQSVDGAILGLRQWRAESPRAALLAVHGMNDYSHAFDSAATYWAQEAGFTVYGLDQRGFGRSPRFGRWLGAEIMKADIRAAVDALRAAHPDLPIFVLGHSMGAAAVMAAEADVSLGADGLILGAPGVWGGAALPIPYRIAAETAGAFTPGKTLTGERANRQATDNVELLRAMFYDPLVIKETRIDAVVGVTRLMGEAYASPEKIETRSLVLIGERDEIIPVHLQEKVAARLGGDVKTIRYPDGWHMLFRDLQAEVVWKDVTDWINSVEVGN